MEIKDEIIEVQQDFIIVLMEKIAELIKESKKTSNNE